MKSAAPIATLFMDIGGVLLSDGWDHRARKIEGRLVPILDPRRSRGFPVVEIW